MLNWQKEEVAQIYFKPESQGFQTSAEMKKNTLIMINVLIFSRKSPYVS